MVADHQGRKYQSGMKPSKPDFRNWQILLQKSKIEDTENLAKADF